MRKFGFALAALTLLLCVGLGFYVAKSQTVPLVFSPWQMLGTLWLNYKKEYVGSDFRTMDPARSNDTTSEGQSYTMLRAVWMADKETFDGAWGWTQTNLERPDHVFSWLWGQLPDGNYGVLTNESGQNSASDADQDIALSLLMAYARWQDPHYLSDAQDIIAGIWENDVVMVGGKPYLAADNLEKGAKSTYIVINPSYFNPAAYQLFAEADPAHPWSELRDDSYELLAATIAAPLDTGSGNLPPDWVWMNRKTGALVAPQDSGAQTTHFSYDALRVPWRLALDYHWFGDERDRALLSRFSLLAEQWDATHTLSSVYTHDGRAVDADQAPAMYGGGLGYFLIEDPTDAQAIYRTKLISLFNPDLNAWNSKLSYYDANWAWFGIALYNNLLPNLTANVSLH